MLIDTMAEKLLEMVRGEKLSITDYSIGVKYAYVEVSGDFGRAMGLSYFPMEDTHRGTGKKPEIGKIREMLSSLNIFDKVLGIATLNAVSQYMLMKEEIKLKKEELIDYISNVCRGGKIAVIGNMGPLIKKISFGEVYVFERNPKFRGAAYPDSFEFRLLPEMDIVIISGTTLINDTIDYILQLSRNAKIRALVGPTSSFHPALIPEDIDILAGLIVKDSEKVKAKIRLGGGRWDFSAYCEEYVVDRKNII